MQIFMTNLGKKREEIAMTNRVASEMNENNIVFDSSMQDFF